MAVVEEEIVKVVEEEYSRTIIKYSKETGLVITQYMLDRRDGIVFSKYLVGKLFLDDAEVSALKEVLNQLETLYETPNEILKDEGA